MRPVHLGSLFPLYIEVITKNIGDGKERVLSSATACLYQTGGQSFLISNWHVFSGLNSETKKNLDSKLGEPEKIRVFFPQYEDVNNQVIKEYDLKNTAGEYNWLEHPLSNLVDVGAMAIDVPERVIKKYLNEAIIATDPTGRDEDFFHVTKDVWVIGYPLGLRMNGLPIWKKATIASEIGWGDGAGKYKIILDTATRQGMSGAPVFFMSNSLSSLKFDDMAQPVDIPSYKRLLGIYSGRIPGEDMMAAQLGIAWQADCIEEIIGGGRFYSKE